MVSSSCSFSIAVLVVHFVLCIYLSIHLYVWCPGRPLNPHDSLVLTNRHRRRRRPLLCHLSFVRQLGRREAGARAGVQGGARQAAARPTRRPAARSIRPTRAAESERRRARATVARHRALVKVFSRPRGTSARASSVSYVTVLHPWKQGGEKGMPRAFKETFRQRRGGGREGEGGERSLAHGFGA